jgi:central glycolytic genes regulator
MWRKLIELQQKMIPDLLDVMRIRLNILGKIEIHQPIGRRGLARVLNQSERILRAEVELLKDQGLIDFQSVGMILTQEGKELLHQLYPFMFHHSEHEHLEHQVRQRLQLQNVMIIPGDSVVDPLVKKEMGRIASHYLKKNIQDKDRIAITGGSSTAALAEMFYGEHSYPDVTIYPARGGLGEFVDLQANQVAARLATNMGGNYVLLQVPDHLSEDTYQSLIREPYIHERITQIRSARMIFHGIGDALTMAEKRGASREVLELLHERKAVSEAFGSYFDIDGNMVYQMPTIGLSVSDLAQKHCIAVAGGSDKATAILSLAKTGIFQVLITDEGAAKQLLAPME